MDVAHSIALATNLCDCNIDPVTIVIAATKKHYLARAMPASDRSTLEKARALLGECVLFRGLSPGERSELVGSCPHA